jgi:sialidase-1
MFPWPNCTYGNCNIHITPGCLHPDSANTDLWCPGDRFADATHNESYECYKIPTLLRVPKTSTLLGFIEARKHSCDDAGYIDLLLRRSDDFGKTWSKPIFVYGNSTEEEWHTIGDALPVYDDSDGSIHLVFTRDNQDAMYSKSTDLGSTWAAPRNISDAAVKERKPKGKGFIGTGHDGGAQLPNGRLLVPMYGGGSKSFILASDDHGTTWQRLGEVDVSPNEWAFVVLDPERSGDEVGSGSTAKLLATLRDGALVFGHRWQATSNDGGVTWSAPQKMSNLVEPFTGCEGSLLKHPNGRLYYSHPDPDWHLLRNIMNIKVSDDDGKTWNQHATIWGPGHGCDKPCVPAASYSSMAVLGDDKDAEIGLFYMRNNVTMIIFEGRGATFTTFKPDAQEVIELV